MMSSGEKLTRGGDLRSNPAGQDGSRNHIDSKRDFVPSVGSMLKAQKMNSPLSRFITFIWKGGIFIHSTAVARASAVIKAGWRGLWMRRNVSK